MVFMICIYYLSLFCLTIIPRFLLFFEIINKILVFDMRFTSEIHVSRY